MNAVVDPFLLNVGPVSDIELLINSESPLVRKCSNPTDVLLSPQVLSVHRVAIGLLIYELLSLDCLLVDACAKDATTVALGLARHGTLAVSFRILLHIFTIFVLACNPSDLALVERISGVALVRLVQNFILKLNSRGLRALGLVFGNFKGNTALAVFAIVLMVFNCSIFSLLHPSKLEANVL